jgi:hypothetical protein
MLHRLFTMVVVPHQRYVVEDRIRFVSHLSPHRHMHILRLFAQLRAVLVHQQRQVHERRRGETKGRVEGEMLGHRWEPLFATEDMCDSHEMVIHDAGQVVRRPAIRLHQDWVVNSKVGLEEEAA